MHMIHLDETVVPSRLLWYWQPMFPILQQKSTGVRDPVCGMTVNPQRAAGSSIYQGQTYHFCSKSCVAKFEANPEKYLHPDTQAEPMEPHGAPNATTVE